MMMRMRKVENRSLKSSSREGLNLKQRNWPSELLFQMVILRLKRRNWPSEQLFQMGNLFKNHQDTKGPNH
jgi:hypothetical protein